MNENNCKERERNEQRDKYVKTTCFINHSKRVPYIHSLNKLGAEIFSRRHHPHVLFIFLECTKLI